MMGIHSSGALCAPKLDGKRTTMKTLSPDEALLFTGVSFTSPSWRLAHFDLEEEAVASDGSGGRCWLIAIMPVGISCKIAYLPSTDIAELLLDSLLIAQAAYAHRAVRTERTANDER